MNNLGQDDHRVCPHMSCDFDFERVPSYLLRGTSCLRRSDMRFARKKVSQTLELSLGQRLRGTILSTYYYLLQDYIEPILIFCLSRICLLCMKVHHASLTTCWDVTARMRKKRVRWISMIVFHQDHVNWAAEGEHHLER